MKMEKFLKLLEKGENLHHAAHALKIGVDSAVALSQELRRHRAEKREREKEQEEYRKRTA
jgi:hypothetical protein